jgi:hypothetical protein
MERYLVGRTVLICEDCGERLVLADPKLTWNSAHPVFECKCGEEFTAENRILQGNPNAGAA